LPDLTLGLAIDGASGLLFVALGLFVASVRPRTAATLSLAAFSACFGAGLFASNIVDSPASGTFQTTGVGVASGALFVLTGAAVLALGLTFPTRLGARDRRAALGAALVAVVVLAAFAVIAQGPYPAPPSISLAAGPFVSAEFFVLTLFALRFRSARDAATRRQYMVLSAGLLVFVTNSGASLTPGALAAVQVPAPGYGLALQTMVMTSLSAGMALLWLANIGVADAHAKAARNVAFFGLGVLLLRALVTPFLGADPNNSGFNGLARTVGVAMLAYAILRHQLLGMDLKVKWTIRRGTVAGIFLAVFFIVGQVAQNVLSTQFGYLVGGVAAGALLFAIAPLQHFAERVADTALPSVPSARLDGDRRRAAYLRTAREAWSDGRLTPKERRLLGALREELALSSDEAERLEHEALPAEAR
jgi:hypothetical protein